ncbi:MAG TPA: PAS domain-containing protein, partial [Thermoleophilaceae bacterium]|nr:PAS domain-containing protein [Thermoleophilaceae bacterium]
MSVRHDDAPARYDETERVAGVGSFDYRPQENLTNWSLNLFRIYGLDPEQAAPLDREAFSARIHPDDLGALDAMFADMARGGFYEADLRFRRFDDVERVVHVRGESQLDAAGNLVRAHGTTQDVTESRATEAELRESRKRMVEAMRVAGVGSFEGRSDTGEFEWSKELRGLYGLDPEGPHWTVPEYLERMVSDEVPAILEPDPPLGPFEFEHDVVRADGALRRYEVRGEVYPVDGVRWVRGTVRDVTAVRRGEAQQAAVATLTRQALEGVPLKRLLMLACEHAASALGAESVGALELQP